MAISTKDLPSRGQYHHTPTEEIAVVPLSLDGLALMSEACTNDDAHAYMQAIQTCTPIDVYNLPTPDFVAIAAHVRCLTFKDTPICADYTCNSPRFMHLGKLITQEEVENVLDTSEVSIRDCNTHVHETYDLSTLPTTFLQEGFVMPEGLAIPNSKHYAEYIELSRNPSYRKLLPAIQWIKEGDTLADKLEFLRNQTDLNLFDLASKTNSDNPFGLRKYLVTKCPSCGMTAKTQLQISQYSFFR